MLGMFEINCGDTHFTSADMSNQFCSLLSFLFIHKKASSESIIDAIWPDGVANPSAALKNLVYRTRKTLADGGFAYSKELIISSLGAYKINSELDVVIDAYAMEDLFSKAQKASDLSQQIEFYKQGIELYKGGFLENLSNCEWVLPLEQHYRTIYFNNMYALMTIYYGQENYIDMLEYSKRAVRVDKYEELAHQYSMLATYKTSGASKAMAYYNYVTELFFNGLDVELSENMQNLYQKISKSSAVLDTDIQTLQSELKEFSECTPEALFCDFEVYKQFHHFVARSAVRSGSSAFMALLTVTPNDIDEGAKHSDISNIRESAMVPLKNAISSSLRKGDVFARCSPSQYTILLTMINFEDSVMVLNRIIKKFKFLFHSRKVSVSYNIQPIKPTFWQ